MQICSSTQVLETCSQEKPYKDLEFIFPEPLIVDHSLLRLELKLHTQENKQVESEHSNVM